MDYLRDVILTHSLLAFALLVACDEGSKEPLISSDLDLDEGRGVAESLVTNPLCKSIEVTLFDCQSGETRIAVCGPKEEDGMSLPAIYREVGPDVATIQISAPSSSQSRSATIARTMYSGGGEVQFKFSSDELEYIAFSRTIRTGPDDLGRWVPEHSAGVARFVDGEFKDIRYCEGENGGLQLSNDASLDKYFELGEFVYLQLEGMHGDR